MEVEHDAKREAVPAYHGFCYQAWRTALAWIKLDESARIYVEGAEDYDVLIGATAETTSVRARGGTISLGPR